MIAIHWMELDWIRFSNILCRQWLRHWFVASKQLHDASSRGDRSVLNSRFKYELRHGNSTKKRCPMVLVLVILLWACVVLGTAYKRSAVPTEKLACITWTTGKSLIAQLMTLSTRAKPCHFSTEEILQSHIGMGCQENSIISTAFDGIIGSVRELGLMKKWETDFLYEMKYTGGQRLVKGNDFKLITKLRAVSNRIDDKIPLRMKNLFSVFRILPH